MYKLTLFTYLNLKKKSKTQQKFKPDNNYLMHKFIYV